MPKRPRFEPAIIAAWLVVRLRHVPEGEHVTRDQLIEELLDRVLQGWGVRWSRKTAFRRLCEGREAALDAGHVVYSDGRGYRLARTQVEREAAARDCRKLAMAHLERERKILRTPMVGDARQLELPMEER